MKIRQSATHFYANDSEEKKLGQIVGFGAGCLGQCDPRRGTRLVRVSRFHLVLFYVTHSYFNTSVDSM
jgi:hypothetical protein